MLVEFMEEPTSRLWPPTLCIIWQFSLRVCRYQMSDHGYELRSQSWKAESLKIYRPVMQLLCIKSEFCVNFAMHMNESTCLLHKMQAPWKWVEILDTNTSSDRPAIRKRRTNRNQRAAERSHHLHVAASTFYREIPDEYSRITEQLCSPKGKNFECNSVLYYYY